MAPELPTEEDIQPTHFIRHPPVAQPDEESEDEPTEAGYIPLADAENDFDRNGISTAISYTDESDEGSGSESQIGEEIQENAGRTQEIVPPIESVNSEVNREIWNQPRPDNLQIELDNTKTEQILHAMSNIKLPNMSVPEWAAGVPEERWKEELLQRIRDRKDAYACTPSIGKKSPH